MKNDKDAFSCQGVRLLHPAVAKKYGTNPALLFGQCVYWSSRTRFLHDKSPVFYKTLDGWRSEFPWIGRATILRALKLLEDEGLISVFSGVIPKIDPRITCYTVNTTHPLVQSILDQDQSKMNQDQSIMDRDQSILDHENAGKSRGSRANGHCKEQQRKNKELAAAPLPPDEDQTQETWLAALPEPERLAVVWETDSELDRRGREVRNRHALRALILDDFRTGRRPLPPPVPDLAIGWGQASSTESQESPETFTPAPIPRSGPTEAEMQAEYAQQLEIMEEGHVCH